jgi:hypothetical protein
MWWHWLSTACFCFVITLLYSSIKKKGGEKKMEDRGYIIYNEIRGTYSICIPKSMRDPYPLLYSKIDTTHNYARVRSSSAAIQGLAYIREANAGKKGDER